MKLSPDLQARINDRLVLRINELYHDLENRLYDSRHGGMHASADPVWHRYFKTHLPPGQGRAVLDYGCGTGYVSRIAATQLGPEDSLISADISQRMTEEAQANLQRDGATCRRQALKITGSGIALPGASLDVIASNSVLHHLPDLAAFAAECRRVLKPKGVLLIGHEPNGERDDYGRVILADRILRMANNPGYFVQRMVEKSALLEKILRGLLSRASEAYRRRNAMLDEIAQRLIEEGLMDRRLRGTEIQQIVDIHTDAGFREAGLLGGPFSAFETIEWTTRHFVSVGGRISAGVDAWAARRFPRAGQTLSFVLRRRE